MTNRETMLLALLRAKARHPEVWIQQRGFEEGWNAQNPAIELAESTGINFAGETVELNHVLDSIEEILHAHRSNT